MNILSHNLLRACAHPRDAWNSLRHWALLAHYAQLPYADVMRFRLELHDNTKFQAHLKRCVSEIEYVSPEAAELYVIVRAAKPKVVVETGVASGISSAHILLALAANESGTLHSIDFPNV